MRDTGTLAVEHNVSQLNVNLLLVRPSSTKQQLLLGVLQSLALPSGGAEDINTVANVASSSMEHVNKCSPLSKHRRQPVPSEAAARNDPSGEQQNRLQALGNRDNTLEHRAVRFPRKASYSSGIAPSLRSTKKKISPADEAMYIPKGSTRHQSNNSGPSGVALRDASRGVSSSGSILKNASGREARRKSFGADSTDATPPDLPLVGVQDTSTVLLQIPDVLLTPTSQPSSSYNYGSLAVTPASSWDTNGAKTTVVVPEASPLPPLTPDIRQKRTPSVDGASISPSRLQRATFSANKSDGHSRTPKGGAAKSITSAKRVVGNRNEYPLLLRSISSANLPVIWIRPPQSNAIKSNPRVSSDGAPELLSRGGPSAGMRHRKKQTSALYRPPLSETASGYHAAPHTTRLSLDEVLRQYSVGLREPLSPPSDVEVRFPSADHVTRSGDALSRDQSFSYPATATSTPTSSTHPYDIQRRQKTRPEPLEYRSHVKDSGLGSANESTEEVYDHDKGDDFPATLDHTQPLHAITGDKKAVANERAAETPTKQRVCLEILPPLVNGNERSVLWKTENVNPNSWANKYPAAATADDVVAADEVKAKKRKEYLRKKKALQKARNVEKLAPYLQTWGDVAGVGKEHRAARVKQKARGGMGQEHPDSGECNPLRPTDYTAIALKSDPFYHMLSRHGFWGESTRR